MNSLLAYLFQSALCMGFLYAVYWIFLRKDTFHLINRIYLILTVALSVMVPLLKIDFRELYAVRSVMIYLDPVIITPEKMPDIQPGRTDWTAVSVFVYFSGVALLLARFFSRLIRLFMLMRHYGIRRSEGLRLVITDRNHSPFSFFHIIFLPANEKESSLQTILDHERVHVRQAHSMDLLMIELVTLLQWFNPFIWLAGQSLKTIHEYLADEGVLKTGADKSGYQQLLLQRAMGIRTLRLTNNFNISLIQNRIVMMTRSSSKAFARLKPAIALPVLTFLLIYFSGGSFNTVLARTDPQEQKKETVKPTGSKQTPTPDIKSRDEYQRLDVQPQYVGGDSARIRFISENISYPPKAKQQGIAGKVFVTFTIESSGKVSNVKVMRGIGGGCDEEAARVVKRMPNWKPGILNGKPVAVQYVLPVKFTLEKKAEKNPEQK